MSYVYILKDQNDMYKIGRTVNSAQARAKHYGNTHNVKMTLIREYPLPGGEALGRRVEAMAHERLEAHRLKGYSAREVFRCDLKTAEQAVEASIEYYGQHAVRERFVQLLQHKVETDLARKVALNKAEISEAKARETEAEARDYQASAERKKAKLAAFAAEQKMKALRAQKICNVTTGALIGIAVLLLAATPYLIHESKLALAEYHRDTAKERADDYALMIDKLRRQVASLEQDAHRKELEGDSCP